MGFFSWFLGKRKEKADGALTATPRPFLSRTRARVIWREDSFPMNAVGESNYQAALEKLCGGHSRYGHELETEAKLVREPKNPHDRNAVAVIICGNTVGYLPREQASRVSGQMAQDGIDRVTCQAKIVGGWRTNQHDKGSFGVRLAMPTWGWIDFGLGMQEPVQSSTGTHTGRSTKNPRPEAAKDGPLKGQNVVIWGASSSGSEARELAALGARIMAGVGKSTTLVVQISDDLTTGGMTSSTYRKAQEHIAQGANLEIVSLKKLRERLS